VAGKKWTDDEVQFVKDNYLNMSCEEMANQLPGRTKRAVQHLFGQLGLERPILGVGDKHGRLTITNTFYKNIGSQNILMANVTCDCGTQKVVKVASMKPGLTVSCGCWKSEQARRTVTAKNLSHGMSSHPLYKIFNGMKARCLYPSMRQFKNYGGRGISVCETWSSDYKAFYDWAVQNGWQPGLTIERKDVNGNYCPENCCWVPRSKQNENKTNNRLLSAFGETKAAVLWSQDPRCKARDGGQILERVDKLGWTAEEAISTPPAVIGIRT